MLACNSGGSDESAENDSQELSNDKAIEDNDELTNNADYVDQEVIPYTLSAELRDDILLKSSEVRETTEAVLTGTFFNYALEGSNEIAFMFSSTVFSEANRDIDSHFKGMKSNPRPGTERESIVLIEINNKKWIHDIYTSPGDPSNTRVHNLVHINGAKMVEVIIATDEPVYAEWKEAINLCIETLKLL